MSKLKRRLKTLGKIAVVIVLVLAAADLVLTLVLSGKVASEIAKLKASGEPTTIAEIAPKKVPDSENAAVIYAKAFEEMERSLADEDSEDLSALLSPEQRLDDPASWARAMKVLERDRHVISLIEQACSRPKCVFPVEWEKVAGAQLPHLWRMRQLERLLWADAIVNALDGRPDEAVRSLTIGLKLSESLAGEPTVISQLMRYALVQMNARSLEVVAQQGHVDASQARRMYDALGSIDLNPGYARAMRMELVFGLWSFDEFRRDPGMIREYTVNLSIANTPGPNSDDWHWLVLPLHSRTPIVYADELVYLKGMEDRMQKTVLPYRTLKTKRPDLLRDQSFPAYAIGSEALLFYCGSFIAKRDDTVAALNGGRVLCALLAYRDRFGGYPRSFGELRSRLGWKLPEDPYSARDFIYRRQGKGCILYSIGVNLKDDGGTSYDYPPPEKPPVKAPIETPPPGYDPTMHSTGETPSPGLGRAETPSPVEGFPPSAPPPSRTPHPPFSTQNMSYRTADDRRSEDIIWQLER